MSNITQEAPVTPTYVLRAVDRCDACASQAYYRTEFKNGNTLDWCAHHYNKHEAQLAAAGSVTIVDEYDKLVRGLNA